MARDLGEHPLYYLYRYDPEIQELLRAASSMLSEVRHNIESYAEDFELDYT